jgi:hypothetical protein
MNEFGNCNHQCSICLIWCDEKVNKDLKSFSDFQKEMETLDQQLKKAEKDLKKYEKVLK